MKTMKDAISGGFLFIEHLYSEDNPFRGLKVLSGFEKLDTILEGFFVGDLIVICSEPGAGKSSFVYSIALNLSLKAKPPLSLALFGLGKTMEQLALKFICVEGESSFRKITRGYIMCEDWPKLTSAAGRLLGSQLHINFTQVTSVQELIIQVSNFVENNPNISLLIVDSLQNLVPKDTAKISECLRTLKAAALKLRMPIIITSSITMKKGPRDDKPVVADQIYNVIKKYSDVVLRLQEFDVSYSIKSIRRTRPSKNTVSSDDSSLFLNALMTKVKTELIIAKNPNGVTGSVFLDYLPQQGKFQSVDEMPHSAQRGQSEDEEDEEY